MSTTSNRVAPSNSGMEQAASYALEQVSNGMRLGLGTGRAAEAFIRQLGERVATGLKVECVSTSIRSEKLATSLSIPMSTVAKLTELDIAFDGADEVTPDLQLTKGLGGALLRERVVAHSAARFVVLVTPEKLVPKLGTRTHIPIEVVPFAQAPVALGLSKLGGEVTVRSQEDGSVYYTDNKNVILDTQFGPINEPQNLDAAVRKLPGVVDTGLFLAMASQVIVGSATDVDIMNPPASES